MYYVYVDWGEGFCVFNDFVIVVNFLFCQKEVEKILIVDLDVYQGNGMVYIFQDEFCVFIFSMYGECNYFLCKEQLDLDIGFFDKIEGYEYFKVLENILFCFICE